MNVEEIREFCLSIKGSEESFPFGDTTIVFKIMNKMFAYMGLEQHDYGFMINLKCDPEKAIELREKYEFVLPGYHSNKKYWNSVYFEKIGSDKLIEEWIKHSVEEVIKKLPKKQQDIYRTLPEYDK